MKKIGKIFGYIFLGIILLITLLLIYVKTMLPSVGNAPDTKVEMSPANIERGKYLANHVSVCIDYIPPETGVCLPAHPLRVQKVREVRYLTKKWASLASMSHLILLPFI